MKLLLYLTKPSKIQSSGNDYFGLGSIRTRIRNEVFPYINSQTKFLMYYRLCCYVGKEINTTRGKILETVWLNKLIKNQIELKFHKPYGIRALEKRNKHYYILMGSCFEQIKNDFQDYNFFFNNYKYKPDVEKNQIENDFKRDFKKLIVNNKYLNLWVKEVLRNCKINRLTDSDVISNRIIDYILKIIKNTTNDVQTEESIKINMALCIELAMVLLENFYYIYKIKKTENYEIKFNKIDFPEFKQICEKIKNLPKYDFEDQSSLGITWENKSITVLEIFAALKFLMNFINQPIYKNHETWIPEFFDELRTDKSPTEQASNLYNSIVDVITIRFGKRIEKSLQKNLHSLKITRLNNLAYLWIETNE